MAYMLSPMEQQQVFAAFSQSAGIDGKIDRNEFINIVVRLNPSLSYRPDLPLISESLFRQVDMNQSGFINVHEFLSAYPRLRAQLGY